MTAVYRSECSDPESRPNSDVIEDCVIDIADVVALTAHYREKDHKQATKPDPLFPESTY